MIDKVQKIREEVEKIKTAHSSVSLKESNPDVLVVQVCTNLLSFIDSMQEEPVSEEMEKAYTEYADERLELIRPDISDSSLSRDKKMSLDIFDGYCIEDAFEAGANWKEQQLEKNRLARCDAQTEEEAEREQEFVMQHIKKYHCQPTFSDAIECGMNLQREQMMKNAIEGEWWRCVVVLPAKYMNTDDIRSVKIIIVEND